MNDDFGHRVKTSRLKSEDTRQFGQMVRRMKSEAFKVEGGAIALIGPQLYPFVWVEERGRAVVERLYKFHYRPDGTDYTDITLKTLWDFTFSPVPNEALARLSVKFVREDKKEFRLNVWFETNYHHQVLRSVEQTGHLMIFTRKPNPTRLEDTQAVGIDFDTALPELKEALDATTALKKPAT